MKKSTKIILMIAGVVALVYVIKKSKTAQPTANNEQQTTVKGGPVLIDIPQAGSPGIRTGVVGGYVDITLRRCVDPNTGKTIYVKGPCPQRNINTVVAVNRG